MNTFKKIEEEGKLFLCITTQDELGNTNIMKRFCKDSIEFDTVVESLVKNIQGKISDMSKQLEELPKIVGALQYELSQLKNI